MEQDRKVEQGVSRRNFLRLSGVFGLALGALSFPVLGWGEAASMAGEPTEEDRRLAHRRRKSSKKRTRRRTRRAGFGANGAGKLGEASA